MKKFLAVLLCLSLILAFAACGSQEQTAQQTEGAEAGQNVETEKKEIHLSWGTGGTTGSVYPFGAAISNIVCDYFPYIQISVEATGGSVENLHLILSGDAEIASCQGDSAYAAYNLTGEFEGTANESNVLALMNTNINPVHVVVPVDSDIESVADLVGKKVAVGAAGSGTETIARLILEACGLTYDDIKPQYLSFSESEAALNDGDIDASIVGAMAPVASLISLATTSDVKLISFSDEEVEKIKALSPFFVDYTIVAGTYEAFDYDVTTVGMPILLCVSANLQDSVVYDILCSIFDHLNEVAGTGATGAAITLESAAPCVIPLHPSAEQFFKERGLSL